MKASLDYWYLGIFVFLMVILFIWITRKNKKEKKILEDQIIQSELGPEKDDENNNDSDSL